MHRYEAVDDALEAQRGMRVGERMQQRKIEL